MDISNVERKESKKATDDTNVREILRWIRREVDIFTES